MHRATSCVWVDDNSSSFACSFFERSFKACVMTNQNHAAPLSRGFWLMHDRVSLGLLTLQTTICLGKDDFFRYQSLETISLKKDFKLTCCNCTSSSSLSPPTPGPWKDTAKRKKVRTWFLSVEIRSVATAIAASLAENLSKSWCGKVVVLLKVVQLFWAFQSSGMNWWEVSGCQKLGHVSLKKVWSRAIKSRGSWLWLYQISVLWLDICYGFYLRKVSAPCSQDDALDLGLVVFFSLLTLEETSLKRMAWTFQTKLKKQNPFQTLVKKTLVKKSFRVLFLTNQAAPTKLHPGTHPTNRHNASTNFQLQRSLLQLSLQVPVNDAWIHRSRKDEEPVKRWKKTRKMMETKSFERIQKRW